jgi:hypothetical protein
MMCLQVPSVLVRKSGHEQYDAPRSSPRRATRYVLPDAALIVVYSVHGRPGPAERTLIFSSRARSARCSIALRTNCSSPRLSTAVRSGGGAASPSVVFSSRISENAAPACSQAVSQAEQFQRSPCLPSSACVIVTATPLAEVGLGSRRRKVSPLQETCSPISISYLAPAWISVLPFSPSSLQACRKPSRESWSFRVSSRLVLVVMAGHSVSLQVRRSSGHQAIAAHETSGRRCRATTWPQICPA